MEANHFIPGDEFRAVSLEVFLNDFDKPRQGAKKRVQPLYHSFTLLFANLNDYFLYIIRTLCTGCSTDAAHADHVSWCTTYTKRSYESHSSRKAMSPSWKNESNRWIQCNKLNLTKPSSRIASSLLKSLRSFLRRRIPLLR